MKKNKLILSCVLVMWSAIILRAQNNIIVNFKNNTELLYAFSNVKSLTFPAGHFSVNKTDGNSEVQLMSDVRNIRFQTGDPLANTNAIAMLSLLNVYPNPLMTDEVKIRYELFSAQHVYIELLDVRSEVQKQIFFSGRSGINETSVNVEGLAAGIYLCRVISNDQVQTVKIIRY